MALDLWSDWMCWIGKKSIKKDSPSSSTASTVAPLLSSACTTVARPLRAARWRGLARNRESVRDSWQTNYSSSQGNYVYFYHSLSSDSQFQCVQSHRQHRGIFTIPTKWLLDKRISKLLAWNRVKHVLSPLFLHLQSTVGGIYECWTVDLPQNQQGTHLMSLRRKNKMTVKKKMHKLLPSRAA